MKTFEVKNYTLYTAGVFSIEFKRNNEFIGLNIDIDLSTVLRMLEIEGVSLTQVHEMSSKQQPLKFKKATLLLFEEEDLPGQYYTSDICQDDDDPLLFHAELKD